jgi:hypothetical protein
MSSADLLPSGSSPFFLQRLAQRVQNLAEGALAGAVAEKAVIVLEFDIETVDVDRRQPGGAVAGDARGGYDLVSHFAPCHARNGRTTTREPIGFMERRTASGEWPVANRPVVHYSPLAIRLFRPKSRIFGRFFGQFSLTHGCHGL